MTSEQVCPRCDGPVPEDSSYCENCGAALTSRETMARVTADTREAIGRAADSWRQQRPTSRFVLTLGVVLLLALLGAERLGAGWKTGLFVPIDSLRGKTALAQMAREAQFEECSLNRAQLSESAYAYLAERENAKLTSDFSVLVPTYLDRVPRCPGGGDYTYSAEFSSVFCSKHEPPPSGGFE